MYHIHQRVDGTLYKIEFQTGRRKLPNEIKLSKRVVASVTESMRNEVDEWIELGYKESQIVQMALHDWFIKQESVQKTV